MDGVCAKETNLSLSDSYRNLTIAYHLTPLLKIVTLLITPTRISLRVCFRVNAIRRAELSTAVLLQHLVRPKQLVLHALLRPYIRLHQLATANSGSQQPLQL